MDNNDLASILMSQATLGDPIRYANLIKASKSQDVADLAAILPKLRENLEAVEKTAKYAKDLRKYVSGDGFSRRKKDASKQLGSLDQQKDLFKSPEVDLSLIIATHYELTASLYSQLVQASESICNAKMVTLDDSISKWAEELGSLSSELGDSRVRGLVSKANEKSSDALSGLALEQKINQGAQASFSFGLSMLEKTPTAYENYLQTMLRLFEMYHATLRERHSSGTVIVNYAGVPSPSVTDAAILVWENIDRAGEIESGTPSDEVSVHTVHRASAMITSARDPVLWEWIVDPGNMLTSYALATLPMIESVKKFVVKVKQSLGESTWKILTVNPARSNEEFVDAIDSLDLSQITYRTPELALSKIERFSYSHKNESIQKVSEMLIKGKVVSSVVKEILELKQKERDFFIKQNSFYVCKIGNGNQFLGEAPGAIQVIPGEKPNANLDKIWGGGFPEVKEFIYGMQDAKRWSPLFLSTSPSKSTDKSNVLLVGPQGSGKTEVLRALSSSDDSISIFAVGSDFLTCWLGEAQKNPKRLWDEAVKLHKSSGMPVHILIDEIDMVLNDDRTSGSRVNLSLEFQNLMDGVVAYPGISIWGATNHPQRIPTPMLRRFAKVMVVGELSEDDRVAILRHYIEDYLPVAEPFTDSQYLKWAHRFDGATGDVIRKAVDEMWLRLMRGFITDHRESAESVLQLIKDKYGEEFHVSQMTDDDRHEIRAKIAETTALTVEMVDQCISHLLDNFAVQQQIKVARDTYRNAALLLERQKSDKSSLGF